MKRSFLLLGLSVFAVFGSNVAGFPGSGGLCTLVLAFLAGLGWRRSKVSQRPHPVPTPHSTLRTLHLLARHLLSYPTPKCPSSPYL